MFFVLSKVLWAVAQPVAVLAVALLVGAVLLWTRWHMAGRRLTSAAAVAFAGAAVLPIGDWVLAPLENRFPQGRDDAGPVDGIIVLGGGSDVAVTHARGRLELNEAGDRWAALLTLARRHPEAVLLISGGSGDIFAPDLREAETIPAFLEIQGIDPKRLIVENRSRNTWENALFSRQVADFKPGQRWLLVTSAFHMPRAVGCFRRVGVPVQPYPVDYRTTGAAWPARLRLDTNLFLLTEGLREWIGLAAYWLVGRTDALFPGPPTPANMVGEGLTRRVEPSAATR